MKASAYQWHDAGLLVVSSNLRKEQSLDDAQRPILDAIAGVVKQPPSQEEMERARDLLLKNTELVMNDSSQVTLGLTEAAAAGDCAAEQKLPILNESFETPDKANGMLLGVITTTILISWRSPWRITSSAARTANCSSGFVEGMD